MKTETRSGDQFATRGELLENKALRIDDTNKANEAQATRFAHTDEERRAIRLGSLKGKQRDLEARGRLAGADPETEATTDSEEVQCSD